MRDGGWSTPPVYTIQLSGAATCRRRKCMICGMVKRRSVRMVLPLQILHFEDLSVGMTETLTKTVSSPDVV